MLKITKINQQDGTIEKYIDCFSSYQYKCDFLIKHGFEYNDKTRFFEKDNIKIKVREVRECKN